jgi:hypothetical protein
MVKKKDVKLNNLEKTDSQTNIARESFVFLEVFV